MKSKTNRVISLFFRLMEGKLINKKEEAARYNVSEREVERDFAELRSFLSDLNYDGAGSGLELVYDRYEKRYYLKDPNKRYFSNDEILALAKILLESRAFSRKEMTSVIERLVNGCVPRDNMKVAKDLLVNEMFHYVELHRKDLSLSLMWELGQYISSRHVIKLDYVKLVDDGPEKDVSRYVEPISIMFSEYYFYLIAYPVSIKGDKTEHWFDYPAIYRIDRIKKVERTDLKFFVPYSSRFQEGEFRKKIQFMHGGELNRIRFKFTGPNLNAILDRLPTAEVISSDGTVHELKVEAFGDGLFMWLLSQGAAIEVLSPQSAREKMKQLLAAMTKNYE